MENINNLVEGGVILSGYETESAIAATVNCIKHTDNEITLTILHDHLRKLCSLQIKVLFEIAILQAGEKCGETTLDGDALQGCLYSPVVCEECGSSPCDESC